MSNARAEEYRRKASACRDEAERASHENKAAWRDLAQRWEEAAVKVDGFDADERQRLNVLQVGHSSAGSAAASYEHGTGPRTLPHISLYQIERAGGL
jgi:hypothetical protein